MARRTPRPPRPPRPPLIARGVLKDYAWGVVDGLARWCGPTGGPQAELWFGVHPGGPSPLVDGGTLADHPEHLGMPLVKLLAAATPLSLQVHPDADFARRGFRDQVTTDDGRPHLFADDAEKSEMLVALAAFDTHAGWRDPRTAARVLGLAGAPGDIVEAAAQARHAVAIERILALDPNDCAWIVRNLVAAATTCGLSPPAVSALARVAASYPGDPGVIVTALLDHHTLQPGQGLAVPAGVIHSYVDGLAVEVMTSSDNVLRLGLTTKTVAVDVALAALHEDRSPVLLTDEAAEHRPLGMPFAVRLLHGVETEAAGGTHRIVLAIDDGLIVGGVPVPLGAAGVLAPSDPTIEVSAPGQAVLVTGW